MASSAGPAVFAFRSSSIEEADRFDAYRDLYSAGSDVDLGGPAFVASLSARRSAGSVIFERILNDVSHERNLRRVRGDSLDHFVLNICLSGTVLFHTQDRSVQLEAGKAVLMNVGRVYRNEARHARIVTVAISRDLVKDLLADPDALHGIISDRHAYRSLGLLLSAFVRMGRDGEPETAAALAEAIRLIRPRPPSDISASVARRRADKIDQAKRTIEGSLGEPGLAPETIADEIGVSRSTLFELFTTWGGILRYIQTRRLQKLRFALGEPEERRTFLELAQAQGFVSESHASRRFSAEFRVAPSRFRLLRRGEPLADVSRASVIYEWVSGLNGQDVPAQA